MKKLLLLSLLLLQTGAWADENDLTKLKQALRPIVEFDGFYDKTKEFAVTTQTSCSASNCRALIFDKKTLRFKRENIWD